MATLEPIVARVLVQVPGHDPVEVGTIEIPVVIEGHPA